METMFLSYGFRDEERDLVHRVEKLLESHNVKPVPGTAIEGRQLTEELKALIGNADGLLAILYPRERREDGSWVPSPWVQSELEFAAAIGKPALAFKHADVVLRGFSSEWAPIEYDDADQLGPLLRLGERIGGVRRSVGRRRRVRLLPQSFIAVFRSDAGNPVCRYKLTCESTGRELRAWTEGRLSHQPGGLFAYLDGVTDGAMLELQIHLSSGPWRSLATSQHPYVELARA